MKRLKWAIIAVLLQASISLIYAANIEHVVQKGDTLYHISKQYGVPVDVLLRANNIPNARSLRVGMKLEIPDTYTVKKGDTLYSIARDNNVALDNLLSLNHIDKAYMIRIGQILVLPQGASSTQSMAENGVSSTSTPPGSSGITSTVATPANPAQTVGSTSPPSPFWPAPGNRVFLTGKLTGGTQISGGVGDPVYSVAEGRVVWVGPYRGYGRVVFVESPESYIYVYGGNETTLVKVGDTVTRGTELANMGINPHLGQACAYFFVYKNGRPLDPKTAPRG